MRRLPLFAASLLAIGLSAASASAAASGDIIEVTGPTIVGFFPPQSEPTKDDDGGYSEGIAHLRFAIENTAACLRDLKPTLRIEVTKTLKVRHGGEEHTFQLPPNWPASAGAYLFAPGKPPRAIHATVGVSSMSFHLPNAAAEYFGVPTCKKKR